MEATMAWRIETDLHPDYLVIRILGSVDAQSAGDAVAAVLREITTHNCSRLLTDIREVEGRMSILETFRLVSDHPAIQGMRAAIVDRPENSEWYEFYETASVNRGYHNKVFTDIEKAIEWLIH
jgi:hypothetical protein